MLRLGATNFLICLSLCRTGSSTGMNTLAELDYMEVVERQKEGYESDANSDEGLGRGSEEEYEEEEDSETSDSGDR